MERVTPISKLPGCILWSEIHKWTPESVLLRFGKLPEGWRLLPVDTFAVQLKNIEKVKPECEYQMAGVRWYGEGVFHRETVVGKEQSATYLYPLTPGALIYNRLFAWKESFAVVPEEMEGLYVSNEFPQFKIDPTIAVTKFIFLLFNTKKVISAVNAVSIGSAAISRNRFKESDFLRFKVPIPPLSIQQKIVAHWEAAQASVQRNHEAISRNKQEAWDVFRKALGIKTSNVICPKLYTAQWREVERWGHELVWRNKNGAYSFAYPVKLLKDICKTASGGTPNRKHKEYYGGEIPWVKTTEVRNSVIYDTEEKITRKGLEFSSAKIFPVGSLIIAMYGQGATRGRTAKLGVDAATNQACLVLTDIDPTLDTDFLWYYLMVSYDEMRGLASGNNQPNLSADLLGGFPIPIPPVTKQAKLKDIFENAQQIVAKIEEESAQIRNQATRDIEEMILGTCPVEVK